MKNKLMLLLTALTLFANSCSTTDTPPPKPPVITNDAWLNDPAAAAEAFVTLGEFAVTPVTAFLVGAVAAVLAADASGFFGRQANATYSFGKVKNVALPSSKDVTANPFETVGKMHNIGLDYINKKSNFSEWRTRFINYDIAAWEELLDIVSPGITSADKTTMINLSKQAGVIEKVQAVTIYGSTTNQNEVISKLSLSPNGKAYVNTVANTVRAMLSNGKNLLEVADYVNGEIAARLKPKGIYSIEEKAILALLTVAKHSGYYWFN